MKQYRTYIYIFIFYIVLLIKGCVLYAFKDFVDFFFSADRACKEKNEKVFINDKSSVLPSSERASEDE